MREIKFRAWLESLQVMVFVHKIEFLNGKNYKIFFKNLQNGEYIDCALAPSSLISRSSAKGDRFVLMQYTGEFDQNGIEICEGDVVISYDTDALPGDEGIIVFQEGALGFLSNEKEFFPFTDTPAGSMDIVGNIHKNPGFLLEKKNERN